MGGRDEQHGEPRRDGEHHGEQYVCESLRYCDSHTYLCLIYSDFTRSYTDSEPLFFYCRAPVTDQQNPITIQADLAGRSVTVHWAVHLRYAGLFSHVCLSAHGGISPQQQSREYRHSKSTTSKSTTKHLVSPL